MLDRLQYSVLSACANDYELFYLPFACANFGGQVFVGRTDPGEEPGRFKDDLPTWPIRVEARMVSAALDELIHRGLLSWRACTTESDREQPFQTTPIPPDELRTYDEYCCITFEDHIERYGYGPHEFYITKRGLAEIQLPEYGAYDALDVPG